MAAITNKHLYKNVLTIRKIAISIYSGKISASQITDMGTAASVPHSNFKPKINHANYGHSFFYAFDLLDLGEKGTWTFREEFKTKCPKTPSTWLCEVVFRKAVTDDHVVIPITLKRTDSGKKGLTIRIEPYIDDEQSIGSFLFDRKLFSKDEMCGGQEMKEEILKSFSSFESMKMFNKKLYVKFFIYVSSCHEMKS